MIENFFASMVTHRFPVFFLFVLALIGGMHALSQLPIDAFPDLANNQVQVLTDAPGMAPLETEQLVTIPIESIMNGLPSVMQVRSTSKFGVSIVTVVFEDSVNVYFARQLVFERLQSARGRLPKGIEPQLGPVATAMGEIYHYALQGKSYSITELKTLQDWSVKYQLRSLTGVAEVNTFGGVTQEYVVTVYPAKLTQYSVTLAEVFDALSRNNANFGAGIIQHNAEQYTVRGIGRVNTTGDIEKIMVATRNGVPVHVSEVASVSVGGALRLGAATKDGNGEVVTGIVMMLKGENSRDVIARVKERVEQIRKTLPAGVTITPFYDQSALVERTVHTVTSNLIESGVLVIVVLLAMLGNIRAALIVALTIPISMMFSIMGMRALGITANIMSLGAIDFGMIVDGSIVMAENCLRRLSHGGEGDKASLEIIQDSVREVYRPILFGVLIITVVYMPILSLQGMEYKMFSPMVFTVCFALLGSLITALLLVPVLCHLLLTGKVREWESLILKLIKPPYQRLLNCCLKHKGPTVALALISVVCAIAYVPCLGTQFVPRLEEGNIIIETRNLPSISLSEALRVSTIIEKTIGHLPEIETVVCRTGRPDLATDPMGVYQTDVYVMLKPREQWPANRSKEQIVEDLRKLIVAQIPGATFNFTQLIAMRVDELVSGVRSDVAVKLFGDDLSVLKEQAAVVGQLLGTIPGQTDLQVETISGSNQLLITPDRERLARYGVDLSNVQAAVQTAIIGTGVSEVLEGRKRFDLRVKFPEGSDVNPLAVENLLVDGAGARRVPLSQLARIEVNEGVDVINREFAQRRIVVQCNVKARDVGSFVSEAQAKMKKSLKLPDGYYLQWGGQFENQQRALNRLMVVVPISILIIFLLLVATFSSVSDALIVLLNVPFALIGGVVALAANNLYLSVPATIGFIALFGVAVLNGLVLISYINKLKKDGLGVDEAITRGCEIRLRPVLLTAMVAVLGFIPMAVSTGAGAEVQKPLATVVIGGIVTSTLLTLLVLPVIYSWKCRYFDDKKALASAVPFEPRV
ncbi:MAG: CusA/CzcA family heavy metal efflux RND transporter [Candidatus Obscuribacterales bacterium]|nr:CusA/CzcA family heavy metal efflux RND transporter [Candidatus Obscuribacterales bacterium]